VTGVGGDEHDQAVDRKPLDSRAGERDVAVLRRVEGAAEDASSY
jgi:hypothetical protein